MQNDQATLDPKTAQKEAIIKRQNRTAILLLAIGGGGYLLCGGEAILGKFCLGLFTAGIVMSIVFYLKNSYMKNKDLAR